MILWKYLTPWTIDNEQIRGQGYSRRNLSTSIHRSYVRSSTPITLVVEVVSYHLFLSIFPPTFHLDRDFTIPHFASSSSDGIIQYSDRSSPATDTRSFHGTVGWRLGGGNLGFSQRSPRWTAVYTTSRSVEGWMTEKNLGLLQKRGWVGRPHSSLYKFTLVSSITAAKCWKHKSLKYK